MAAQAVMNGPRARIGGASATFGFLSAPVDEPAADAVTDGSTDHDGLDDVGAINGTALLAESVAFNGDALCRGDSLDDAIILNGTRAQPRSAGNGGSLGSLGEPADLAVRTTDGPEALTASVLLPEVVIPSQGFTAQARPASDAWDASDTVTEIYMEHYSRLVRLALLLLHDVHTAEEVVQDSFEAMHLASRRLRDQEKALSYLRQSVVNRARSVLRHRKVVDLHAPKPAPDEPSAEHAVLALLERSAVVSALRLLPERQREAVVLRYYGDLSEAEIAQAMGISRGAVKSHTARAMATLKSILVRETP
jgi:RNA polymerase sigma-70 factor (sigma-E family)